MSRMQAMVYRRYGGPEVLHLEDIDTPEPGADDIRIRVHAVEATKSDCEMRSFRFAVRWFWLPLRLVLGLTHPRRPVLGSYFAGVVDAVGAKVTRFARGDAIFGSAQLHLGAYAEYLCLPVTSALAPKPHNLSFVQAAAVPLGGLNALHFLRLAHIQPGEHVLVNGAGASIGTFGVQIAKAMGAEVTAVDAAHKLDMLRSIGADHVIDYARDDFTRRPGAFDVIFNMVAATAYSGCLRALRPGGRYLMANPRLTHMVRAPLTNRFTNKRALFAFAGETEAELLALKQMLEAGTIAATIDQVLPLARAADAHRRVESEQRIGSVVLALAGA